MVGTRHSGTRAVRHQEGGAVSGLEGTAHRIWCAILVIGCLFLVLIAIVLLLDRSRPMQSGTLAVVRLGLAGFFLAATVAFGWSAAAGIVALRKGSGERGAAALVLFAGGLAVAGATMGAMSVLMPDTPSKVPPPAVLGFGVAVALIVLSMLRRETPR